MERPPKPSNELGRIQALHDLRVLDTEPEERFDRITRLLCRLFDCRIALISLIDSDRQWFKSNCGLKATETERDISFCGHAILSSDALVVEDALLDSRFYDNPLVTGYPHIRFYAGHPLKATTGHVLGTLCLIDDNPRQLSVEQRATLSDFAELVEQELDNAEIRRLAKAEYAARQEAEKARAQLATALADAESANRDLDLATLAGNVGLYSLNKVTRELRMNQMFRSLLEIPASADEQTCRNYLQSRVIDADLHKLMTVFSTLDSGDFQATEEEIRVMVPRRGLCYLQLTAMHDYRDGNHYTRGSVVDVTRIRNTERRLREELSKQEQIFAVVGHELRTPASALKMLLADQQVKELEPHGRVIDDTVTHLLNVLDDMRIITQPELVLESPQVEGSVADIVERSLPLISRLLQENNLRVLVNASNESRSRCIIREQLIRQITLNLVKNCAIHSGATELVIDIQARKVKAGDEAEMAFTLRFSDNGRGIRAEDKLRLFEAFERGDTQADGTGLGLHVSRTYARTVLKGDMTVGDSPTGGAEFTLTAQFPIAALPRNDDAVAVVPPPYESVLDGVRVLYAEDSAVLRMMTIKMLQKQGAEVIAAVDGREAIALAKTHPFDLVMTDLFMPNADGYEVTKQLRESGFTGPIYALTAAVVGDELERVKRLGANEVLPKPFEIDEFKASVFKVRHLMRKGKTAGADNHKPRILVIDDDPITLGRYEALLSEKYEVMTDESGLNAIDDFHRYSPDLILTDVNMPNVSGFEVLKEVQSLNPSLPIVLMSSSTSKTHYLRIAKSFGATAALDKQADDQHILDTVSKILMDKHEKA